LVSPQIKAKSLLVRIVFGDWYNFAIKLSIFDI